MRVDLQSAIFSSTRFNHSAHALTGPATVVASESAEIVAMPAAAWGV